MKKVIEFLDGVNPVVLMAGVMAPLISTLLVVVVKLNSYSISEPWGFVVITILATLISYALAFACIGLRTGLVEKMNRLWNK